MVAVSVQKIRERARVHDWILSRNWWGKLARRAFNDNHRAPSELKLNTTATDYGNSVAIWWSLGPKGGFVRSEVIERAVHPLMTEEQVREVLLVALDSLLEKIDPTQNLGDCPCSGICCLKPRTITPKHDCPTGQFCEECYGTECTNCGASCHCDL